MTKTLSTIDLALSARNARRRFNRIIKEDPVNTCEALEEIFRLTEAGALGLCRDSVYAAMPWVYFSFLGLGTQLEAPFDVRRDSFQFAGAMLAVLRLVTRCLGQTYATGALDRMVQVLEMHASVYFQQDPDINRPRMGRLIWQFYDELAAKRPAGAKLALDKVASELRAVQTSPALENFQFNPDRSGQHNRAKYDFDLMYPEVEPRVRAEANRDRSERVLARLEASKGGHVPSDEILRIEEEVMHILHPRDLAHENRVHPTFNEGSNAQEVVGTIH